MRHLGFIVACFGLLGLCSAAPDRERRQAENDLLIRCREIFNASCDKFASSVMTPPPLNRDIIVDANTSDCTCVQYYQCRKNQITRNGLIEIDRRLSRCSGIVEVCCEPAFIVPDIETKNTMGLGSTPRPLPSTTQTSLPVPVRSGCGHRKPGGVAVRLTGINDEAQFAEFPWMVAVLQKPVPPATQNRFLCGGSLIHPRAILTAAHNIEWKRPANLIIRAGEWDTQTMSEPIPHQEREVQEIIIHENYNTNNLNNDFAILILRKPVDIADNVDVICLPEASDTFDAARCTATGWGKDKFEQSGKFQAVLKKMELPIVPHRLCENSLRLTRLGQRFSLHSSCICAGGEPNQDACTGDGGGPLVCPLANTQDRYVQAGIVSWGIGCGADQRPGVYANVAKARRWIDLKMTQYNLNTSTYVA